MRRHSVIVPPKKKAEKAQKKHELSPLLASDKRALSAPRHVEVVEQLEGKAMFCVKIYAALDAPGSELMTVSCVSVKASVEVEMRFDEKFPVSIAFRKQSDEERVAYAKGQILKQGGFDALSGIFGSVFPEFSV